MHNKQIYMVNIDVIILFDVVRVKYRQLLLQMSKILVYIYTTEKCIKQFLISYITNTILHANKVYREQVEK